MLIDAEIIAHNRNPRWRPSMASQHDIKMIFADLDVLLIMGLNIGETDKVFLH